MAELSDDQVADQITTWAGRVAAGEARLLGLIAEFDRREAWAGPGMLSCAHWLSWRVGMGLKAAHERVRVARALATLPVLAQAFAGGQLSWTQVRAITRVATTTDEASWLEWARHATGAQLERLVRGVRRAQRLDEDTTDPEAAAWRDEARVSYDEGGTLVIRLRLSTADGALVVAALEQARAALDHQLHPGQEASDSSAEDPPRPAVSAAAGFVHLARIGLESMAHTRPESARRHRSQLTAHIDPLSGWARLTDGELLPPGTLPGLDSPAWRLRPLVGADLTRFDLGRTQRLPSLDLRELLGTVDGHRCRFPGCTRRRKLHAHHVKHWSCNGATDLNNLVLLCSRHHTLVHAQGFHLQLHTDRSLTVTTAEKTPVPHHPVLPWHPAEELDATKRIAATTLPPTVTGQRLDLGYAGAVVLQQAA